MHLTLFGEIQLFLLIAATSASFLYWINYKYKSLNRQIIRAIDIPVYLLNRQGFVVKLLNTPTEKANRLPFQNLGTLNIKDLVTDADECRKYMTSLLRVLNTRTSDSLTLKIRIESGEKLYIAVRMVYLNRNNVMAFIRDITEDEVQRRENEKYRFFLESILENLPIATTVKDKNDEGRYLIWNKKAAEMMEVPAEDIVGHYEEEFKPLMQDNFIQETDKEVEESETPQSYIKHFVNPKGREYILSFHKNAGVLQQRKREVDCQFCTGHHRTAGSQRESRRSQPPEIGFSRQHEPRNTHSTERHRRILLHTFRCNTRRRYKGIHTYHRRKTPSCCCN